MGHRAQWQYVFNLFIRLCVHAYLHVLVDAFCIVKTAISCLIHMSPV